MLMRQYLESKHLYAIQSEISSLILAGGKCQNVPVLYAVHLVVKLFRKALCERPDTMYCMGF